MRFEQQVTFVYVSDGEPRYNEDYDIEHFYAHDPDGYAVEIQRFCSDEWPAPTDAL